MTQFPVLSAGFPDSPQTTLVVLTLQNTPANQRSPNSTHTLPLVSVNDSLLLLPAIEILELKLELEFEFILETLKELLVFEQLDCNPWDWMAIRMASSST